jgi:hypothetical protein
MASSVVCVVATGAGVRMQPDTASARTRQARGARMRSMDFDPDYYDSD